MTGFTSVETTVSEIHEAMRAGDLTSVNLVKAYLDRIESYDRGGPELNGIVTVNSEATDRAAELDRTFEESGPVGPLHGVPILVKDQAMTAGLRTTFGSETFAEYVPETDATIVEKLRAAGGIVLAKTNLPDWAAGFVGYSSVLGQTKNPYGLDRDPGGSSAGTAAGVAANLGAVGIGEDTGGSIRVPAACCNLFGLRVTTGLISRAGLSPLLERQDTAGPIARTIEDLARVLDVLVGYDPDDPRTGAVAGSDLDTPYHERLDAATLEGARIGVLREAFGDPADPDAASVTDVVDDAIDTMADAGATVVDPVSIPDLADWLAETFLYGIQSKWDIDAFLADLPDAPVDSIAEIYESGAYHEDLDLIETLAAAPADPSSHPDYWRKVEAQDAFRREILATVAAGDLDAVAFPDVQVPPQAYEPRHTGEASREDFPVNTTIASQSGCPAISMPAGFVDGLPVGIELLGVPHSEPLLLSLAATYESVMDPRRPPQVAPPL